ncbi:Protein of unknown function [Pyronema omphalodes CBS 100304]|uniref:Uncharacterized protein n=1 Tax=Pyronema omphalodes (strain CBS 100304) TaxID=1076935 RepID=U4L8C5_PYROM|nr:Protein of unknown function [Pyronema omphalodes CBS 100304]
MSDRHNATEAANGPLNNAVAVRRRPVPRSNGGLKVTYALTACEVLGCVLRRECHNKQKYQGNLFEFWFKLSDECQMGGCIRLKADSWDYKAIRLRFVIPGQGSGPFGNFA